MPIQARSGLGWAVMQGNPGFKGDKTMNGPLDGWARRLGLVMAAGYLLVCMSLVVYAQIKKPDAPPALPDAAKLQIRDAQLDQAELVTQLTATIDKYNALQAAMAAQAKKLDDLKAAALADLKLDPEKWDVDMRKLAVIPRPEKPPVKTPPADKKGDANVN